MQEIRRLKRGLKDVVPTYHSSTEQKSQTRSNCRPARASTVAAVEPQRYCLGVYSPHSPADSLLLNTYFASKLATEDPMCTIVSLHPGRNPSREAKKESLAPHLDRVSVFWDQWGHPKPQALTPPEKSHLLFLDFDSSNAAHFEKVLPLLDKWILLVQPHFESLSEAYKVIKAAAPLNQRLEYFLLFGGQASDERGALLFERFSELVANRLNIDLVWLGSLHLPCGSESLSAELAPEHLFLKTMQPHDSVEKRSLLSLIA